MPQLFRYERQQRGRLREHFQLNVDIIGETDVTADAELLAVAIEIMRGCGLTSSDVRARVSDRRLLRAILTVLGVSDAQSDAVFGVVDKLDRQPRDVSREKLVSIGMSPASIEKLFALMADATLDRIEQDYGASADVAARVNDFRRYFSYLEGLGVLDWVTIDLKIVRGLAYYTGIVFELFDAKGELRAICGGGRYDTLLQSLGGVDLPALGFGMGDVVLAELLRDRGLLPSATLGPQVFIAAEATTLASDVRRAATALRLRSVSVEYALREQQLMKQVKAAKSAGASFILTLHDEGDEKAPRADDGKIQRHSWSPAPPREWETLITELGL
jgi:histidyl-tRNA synthetase